MAARTNRPAGPVPNRGARRGHDKRRKAKVSRPRGWASPFGDQFHFYNGRKSLCGGGKLPQYISIAPGGATRPPPAHKCPKCRALLAEEEKLLARNGLQIRAESDEEE